MFFRRILTSAILCVLFVSFSADALLLHGSASTVVIPATLFTHVQIGGAGAITGISSVPSANLLLVRTDQYGCYKSTSNSQWSELITTASMPPDAVLNADGGPASPANGASGMGCEELVADPTTTSNLWVLFQSSVFFSSNSGATWSPTCYPAQSLNLVNTSPQKGMGHKIAVDPANSDIVYMGTYAGPLELTVNQGSTCSAVSGPATPTSVGGNGGGYLIAFDTSGGTTTSCAGSAPICTKNIYVSSYGNGVYQSTNGGQTFTLTTGTPTTHFYMTVDPNGTVWFVDNSGGTGNIGTAHKFSGGTWSAPSFSGNDSLVSVAFDPNNCSSNTTCHVAFLQTGGGANVAFTTNSGGAWAVTSGFTYTTSDVPWLSAWNTHLGLFFSGAAFDNSGHLYTGVEGVAFITPTTTNGASAAWTSQTAGIEEIEANTISTSPGTSGSMLVAAWDVGCFAVAAPYTTFPGNGNHGCSDQPNFEHGYTLDWASSDPTFFASVADNQQGCCALGGTYGSFNGSSSNSGGAWTPYASIPSAISSGGLVGGCTAASSSTNILWAPTDGEGNTAPFYSTDGFATAGNIHQISVSGVTGGWGFEFFLDNHFCAADRVNAGTFYIYNWNTGSGSPSDAFIQCTGGGTTCTRQSSPGFGPNEQINPTLKTMPGQASTFFFAFGINNGLVTAGNNFVFSTNGGESITTIANFSNVTAFGFGAPFSGHTMPAIVAVGYFNNVYGIWRSIDWDTNKTWQQIGTFPLNLPLPILDVDGDKSVPGVFFYATGSGLLCGALSASQCNGGT
jgi:hypothetical protein